MDKVEDYTIYTPMHIDTLLTSLTQKQASLNAMRPFSPDIVKKIQEYYRIEFSYHSNHLEGNTLTMKETRALLTTQIVASTQNRKLRDWTEMN